MKNNGYESVKNIYLQGIKTKIATFQTKSSSFKDWDTGHIKKCSFVAVNEYDEIDYYIKPLMNQKNWIMDFTN